MSYAARMSGSNSHMYSRFCPESRDRALIHKTLGNSPEDHRILAKISSTAALLDLSFLGEIRMKIVQGATTAIRRLWIFGNRFCALPAGLTEIDDIFSENLVMTMNLAQKRFPKIRTMFNSYFKVSYYETLLTYGFYRLNKVNLSRVG